MATRSKAKLHITFALLSIPVAVHKAAGDHDTPGHLYHAECGSRIKRQNRCEACDKALASSDISWGAEVPDSKTKGDHVIFTDAERDQFPLPTKGKIDVEGTVPIAGFPRQEIESFDYLTPLEGGEKAFAVLRDALHGRSRLAVGRMAVRDREKRFALEAGPNGTIVMWSLRWADEMRPAPSVAPAQYTPEDVKLAESLVEMHLVPDPRLFLASMTDRTEEALRQAIAVKVGEVEAVEYPKEQAPVAVDLAEQLRRSLKALVMSKK